MEERKKRKIGDRRVVRPSTSFHPHFLSFFKGTFFYCITSVVEGTKFIPDSFVVYLTAFDVMFLFTRYFSYSHSASYITNYVCIWILERRDRRLSVRNGRWREREKERERRCLRQWAYVIGSAPILRSTGRGRQALPWGPIIRRERTTASC